MESDGLRGRPHIANVGFSIISNPPDANTDLVFVHGLQGNPERTWTYVPTSPKNPKWQVLKAKPKQELSGISIYWPYDFLAKRAELSKTRILVWGYDSHVTKFFSPNNKQNIPMHGNDLLVALEQERKSQSASTRPLVFVAHSLGGILVKVALDNSCRSQQRKYQQVFESTKAIIFLGTPHGGSGTAAWGLTIANLAKFTLQDSNPRVLKGLSPDNELLSYLHEAFLQLLAKGNIKVHTFYETKPMTGIYGIQGMVVPFESARIGDIERETLRGIDGNHSEICKFASTEDEGYRAVSGAISDYITEAATTPQSNTQDLNNPFTQFEVNHSVDAGERKGGSSYTSFSEQSTALSRTNTMVEGSDNVQHSSPPALAGFDPALSAYVLALKLPEESNTLQEDLVSPDTATSPLDEFDWLFENPEFKDWCFSSSTAILWLGGSSDEDNSRVVAHVLQDAVRDGHSVFYAFFPSPQAFDDGKTSDKRSLDVMQTLIRQLVDNDIGRIQFAMKKYGISSVSRPAPYRVNRQTWMISHLLQVLQYSLVAVPDSRVYVFIHGVDSYEFVEQLNRLATRLADREKLQEGSAVVKILFSSPPRVLMPDESKKILAGIPYIEKEKEVRDCLQTLHSTDFEVRPSTVVNAESFTVSWLWEDETYRKWDADPASSLLLIQGKPGSGKSTLAKQIVKRMRAGRSSNFSDDSEQDDEESSSRTTSDTASIETTSAASSISRSALASSMDDSDEDEDENIIMAYFFYSFRGGKVETSHEGMLRSILYQILDQEHSFYPLFQQHYRAHREDKGGVRWELPTLLAILDSIATFDRPLKICIILDAMDESDDDELPQILDAMINGCSGKGACIVKGLMTTRPLKQKLAGAQMKQLSALSMILEEKNRGAIAKMVDKEIGSITKDILDEDDTVETTVFDGVKEYIKSHAAGVFLWVTLVLKEIKTLSDEGWTQSNLDELKTILPPELMDLYKTMMSRIADAIGTEAIKLGIKLLNSAAFAERRLSIDETRDAIVVPTISEPSHFDPNASYFKNRIQLLQRRLRTVCGDLLEFKSPYVQLVHESVREFLLHPDRIAAPFDTDNNTGRNEMASCCVRYLVLSLSQGVLERAGIRPASVADWSEEDYTSFARLLDDRPFLDYVLCFLSKHLEMADKPQIHEEFGKFLDDIVNFQPVRYFLLETHILPGPPEQSEIGPAKQFRTRVLVVATKSGLSRALKPVVTAGANVYYIDPETGVSLLQTAVVVGHGRVVENLLDLGASPYVRDSSGETALHKAVRLERIKIASLLVKSSGLAQLSNMLHQTPLHLAARQGQAEMIGILASKAMKVDTKDPYGRTALHFAVVNGHYEVVRKLLELGASSKVDAEYSGTPLHAAVDKNNIPMTKLLLEHGADIKRISNYGGSVLHIAAAEGLKEMVSLLIGFGADIECKDRYGWKPIDWARKHQHGDVVDVLLEAAKDESGEEEDGPAQNRRDSVLPILYSY